MVLFSFPPIATDYFSLSVQQKVSKTYLRMQVFSPTIHTGYIPQTYHILSQVLPSIHSSQCFNEKGLSFSQEVKKTEIGHLFEHILLEYLYQFKVTQQEHPVIVKGETSWNWHKDPKGVFHIVINLGFSDAHIFPFAVNKSITLLEKILQYDPYVPTYNKQMVATPSV